LWAMVGAKHISNLLLYVWFEATWGWGVSGFCPLVHNCICLYSAFLGSFFLIQ
jgi:hypothetical protein